MNKPIENDKIKRKRLKVISACGECRRKKTKCNGEYPCTGCLKAKVECKYAMNDKPGGPTSIIRERLNNNVHLITQPVRKKSISPPPPPPPPPLPLPLPSQITTTAATSGASTSNNNNNNSSSNNNIQHMESIEERLSAIEDMLQKLLGSSERHRHMLDTLESSSYPLYNSNNNINPRLIHRDFYPPIHVPTIQNRSLSREKRPREEEEEEEPRTQLAPIKTMHHTVGTPTLRDLLNDEPSQSSAFHRLSPNNTLTANNTTTTAPAAGDNTSLS